MRDPRILDSHPWQYTRFVQQYVDEHPEATEQPPGTQLALAVADLFRQFIPTSPPRRKKRIDTRWAEFGILAANYFAPFLFGKPYPRSLRDSWDQIDAAILLFVFSSESGLGDEQRSTYQLVDGEVESAANSTLSDWHRNGLERFAQFVGEREQTLQIAVPEKAPVETPKKKFPFAKVILAILLIASLAAASLLGWKAWRINTIAQALLADARAAQQIKISPETPETLLQAGPILESARTNLYALDAEVRPYLWVAPRLAWVPTYGGEIANAEALLDFSLALLDAADQLYPTAESLIQAISQEDGSGLDGIISTLVQASPQFTGALADLERAQAARQRIDTGALMPQLRDILVEQYDPRIAMVRQGLLAAQALPDTLGAAGTSRTYLVMVQNEDEIRSTGGYLTAVGQVVAENGHIRITGFEDAYAVDDLNKTYPTAPWQLNSYMDAEILMLRDANWFPDFPKTAEWVEYLYAYTRAPNIDGLIAVDQYSIVQFLAILGPVQLEGVDEPISAENVIEFIRKSKTPPPGVSPTEWDRKASIEKLAKPLFEKVFSGQGINWQALIKTGQQLLDQKHILVFIKDPTLAEIIAGQKWDGRISPTLGDYLMVIDSNVGINKANAYVSQEISYQVNLTEILKPASRLAISHHNLSPLFVPCEPGLPQDYTVHPELEFQKYYNSMGCYINYLRVYTPSGTKLGGATPHAVPGEWLAGEEPAPARVDVLDENIKGIQAFGTLLAVPTGEMVQTAFKFSLPPNIILKRGNTYLYRLLIQKQPGTIAIPLNLSVSLPPKASNIQLPAGAVLDGNLVTIQLKLLEDTTVEIIFDLP